MNSIKDVRPTEIAPSMVLPTQNRLPTFTVRVARTIAEVEAIRDVWSSWKTHRDSDIDYCQQTVWSGENFVRPHVIVLYRDGRPVTMLVGRIERSQIIMRLGYLRLPKIPAMTMAFAYQGALGSTSLENSAELIKCILAGLKNGEAELANFQQTFTDSNIYKAAIELPRFVVRDHLTVPMAHHVMRLPKHIDEVYKSLSSGLRAEVRRKKRKILADFEGRLSLRCFRDAGDLANVMPLIEQVAQKTYQRGLSVGFHDTHEMRRRFSFCAEKGWLRLYLLTIDDKPCAFWTGTVYEGSFCSDFNGYDPHLRDYSIGSFLLISMVEEFCEEGVKSVDFGFGSAEYKERFGNDQWMESSLSIFAPNAKGIALNAVRISVGLANRSIKTALERTNLLHKIKKNWRARLSNSKAQKP